MSIVLYNPYIESVSDFNLRCPNLDLMYVKDVAQFSHRRENYLSMKPMPNIEDPEVAGSRE